MRAPGAYAVAVRRPGGEVVTLRRALARATGRHPISRAPFARGVVALLQSLVLGIRALNYSAEQALDASPRAEGEPKAGVWAIVPSLVLALAFGLAVFFYLPLLITEFSARAVPALGHGLIYNLLDGVIRIVFFVLYILGISMFRDIRRVFEYHGAEHKVVSTFEAGQGLTVENARRHSTLHPRCGTSFLLFVMVLSVLVFSLVPSSAPFGAKLLARLVLLPLIAGSAYEVLRMSARHRKSPFYALVVAPGLWMQRLTTREPSDDQLAVAIEALRAALEGELPAGRREAVLL